MKTVYTSSHKKHAPDKEFSFGEIISSFEKPERAEYIITEVQKRKLGAVISPNPYSLDKITRIHSLPYVDFLQSAYKQWEKEGFEGPAMGCVFNQHHNAKIPGHIEGKMGYFMADTTIALTETSWEAIEQSAYVALTGQSLISNGEKSAFALCRPPGHHATAGVAAGYCYINNVAIAAQGFLDNGAKKVAILDVDYHHGNGTQEIFYERDDVFFTSIHADPYVDYPHYLGYTDETGAKAGEGFNKNYPLPYGTDWSSYSVALEDAVKQVENYNPDVLLVSLGVDTFKDDPISRFKLESNDYFRMGKAIAKLGMPALFVMEGGYAVEDVGVNTVNVLEGYSDN